ncbi:WD40/YVTN/BNR-like repeat-containing protein [Serinibacter arcticus]|uniref:WD40/YVTN/BNR-like repeat-containing protein n=1 Tax=Serinibacter arcticus TaxID=1655435 RepID=UPI001091F499|nr:hypothetical protein [Serinibacter arcticus]
MTTAGRPWALVLVAILVVLNGIVLTVLLTADGPVGSAAPSPSVPASAAPAVPIPGAEEPASQVPTEDPSATIPLVAPASLATRQIVAVDGDVAWRSTLASCGQGAALVERTLDGGASWDAAELDIDSVVRLRATDAGSAFVVGAAQDCATALASTTDGGDTWSRADATLSSAWFLAPTDRTFVAGPRGDAPVPCPAGAVDLAAVDVQRGAVLCQDGSLAISADGGQSWATTVSVAGARALTQNGSAYVVATFEGPCEALSVYGISSDGQSQNEPLACAPVTTAGDVAVSITGDLLWVWSGADLAISEDGGQTW